MERPCDVRYRPPMRETSVIIALVAVVVVGGLLALRLQRATRRGRVEGATASATAPGRRLSTSDQRFQLLSFQGGPVPADLGPMMEELRRNGIEVDEETLRRKLTEGVAHDDEPPPQVPADAPPESEIT